MCSGVMLSGRAIYVPSDDRSHLRVCGVAQQQTHHRRACVRGRQDQRRQTGSVQRVHVRATAQKQLRDVHAVLAGRPVERRADFGVGSHGEIGAVVQKEGDDFQIALAAGDLDGRAVVVDGVDVGALADEVLHSLERVAHTRVREGSVAHFIDRFQLAHKPNKPLPTHSGYSWRIHSQISTYPRFAAKWMAIWPSPSLNSSSSDRTDSTCFFIT